MDTTRETTLARVLRHKSGAKQARDIDDRWSTMHSSVWAVPHIGGSYHRVRGGQKSTTSFAKHGLSAWRPTHEILVRQSPNQTPPTGEPDAGEPPVRFGGRGSATQCAVPTPINAVRLHARPASLPPSFANE